MEWEETRAMLAPCFPPCVREELEMLLPGELREIRVRAGRRTVLVAASRQALVDYAPDKPAVEALAEALTENGLYARGEETRKGYVTLRGGHRMGLCGRVLTDGGGVRALHDIASVCIRIAGQWPGCADALLPWLRWRGQVRSALLIGPPGSGKTTLLRDVARQLGSGENAVDVALCDERGELAACAQGEPQLDVGERSDVLDGCPKAQAVQWFLRAMAPRALIMDELAGAEDAACVLDAVYAGVPVITSVHGEGLHDVAQRPVLAALMARKAFGCYAVLDSSCSGRVAAMYDRAGGPLGAG